MHRILRIVVAAVVLVAFSFVATDSGFLLASLNPAQGSGSCPLHMAKCCCPKACKTPPKAKPSCHKSAAPIEQVSTAKATAGDACVLKAGCDTKETRVAFLHLLKDFVSESLEATGFDPARSILPGAKDRFPLLDSSPQFFHPPRNS
jgi:hypothetical protein